MRCIDCNGVWVCGADPDCKDLPPSLDLDSYMFRSTLEASTIEGELRAAAYGDEPVQESAEPSAEETAEPTTQWCFGGFVDLRKKKRIYMWCGTVQTTTEVAYAVVVGHSKDHPNTGGMTWIDVATNEAKVAVSGKYNVWYRTPDQGGWEVAIRP